MEVKLLASVQLVEKTMSCLILKFWAWIVIAFCFVAATLIGAGVGLIGNAFEIHSTLPAQIGSVVGFCVCGYLAFIVRGTTMLPRRVGHIRVLVVSAMPRTQLDQALAAGADGVLEKPFKNENLVEEAQRLAGVNA